MALLAEWGARTQGVVCGVIGMVLGLITWFAWRKMENKPKIHITGKTIATALVAIVGTLGLGVGMCNVMIRGNVVMGIGVGLIGIVVLLCLIPMWKGIVQ